MQSFETNRVRERRSGHPTDILVVDDEAINRDLLRVRLGRAGFSVRTADSVPSARAALEHSVPDLLLLDIVMPEVSGLDLLVELRRRPATRELPVIMVTAENDTADVVKGLSLGANDYVVKPVDFSVLQARVLTHLRLSRVLEQVRLQQEVLRRLVAIDELTGVYNRRGLQTAFASCRDGAGKDGLAVLVLDIDHFKAVNDGYGHPAGDAVLVEFARRVRETLRPVDVVGRWGGEEFCVVLGGVGPDEALSAAERVRRRVGGRPIRVGDAELSVTVSIGVATSDGASDLGALQALADTALYRAKADGRDRVVMAS